MPRRDRRNASQLYDAVTQLHAPSPRRMSRATFERERRGMRIHEAAPLVFGDKSRLSKLENRRPVGAAFTQRVAKLYSIDDPLRLLDEVVVDLRIVEDDGASNDDAGEGRNAALETSKGGER